MINLHCYKKILAKSGGCADKIFSALGILILIINIYFIYHYCYLTAHDAKVVLALKNQLAVNVVDMVKWEQTNKNREWKKTSLQEVTDWNKINDPF